MSQWGHRMRLVRPGSVAYLECLVEVLHHPDPLACLLGKLGCLTCRVFTSWSSFLVHVGLGPH